MTTAPDPVARIAAAFDVAAANPDVVIPAPLNPPAAWFRELPDGYVAPPQGPLVQIDLSSGRVAALVAPYGECILDGRSGCWTPGRSKTNYEYAHVGAVVTAEGETLRTANVGGGINHFDTSLATAASMAADHYANTATRRMVGRFVDMPDVGIMFLGSMYPGSTHMHAYEAMTSALSGDWRWIESLRDHEMVGAQLVNNPGFRPNPLQELRPVVPSVSFRSLGTMVASASDCVDQQVIVSEWAAVEVPRVPLAEQFARLEALTAGLMGRMVDDEPMLPSAYTGEVDDDDDGEDWEDEFADLADDECRFCRGEGCAKCDWMGYTGPEMTAVAASLRATEAVVAARRTPGLGRPRDGDGDGFVYDGTMRERPFNPLTDLVGRAVSTADIDAAASGDRTARNAVRMRAAKNFDMAVERKQRPTPELVLEATLGPRPADPAAAARWEAMNRDVQQVFQQKARGVATPDGNNPFADAGRNAAEASGPIERLRQFRSPEAQRQREIRAGKRVDLQARARRENFDAKQLVADLNESEYKKGGAIRGVWYNGVYWGGDRVANPPLPNEDRHGYDPKADRMPDRSSLADKIVADKPGWAEWTATRLANRLFDNGGFTWDPQTGTFPEEGVAVAVPGNSMIVDRETFEADPEQFLTAYLRRMRDDGATTTMIGGWHDKENDEIVFDRVDVVADRDDAVRMGTARDEQYVYDLATGEEIATGGTGGRDNIDIIGRQDAAGDGGSGQAGQGPDRRGDQPLREASGDGVPDTPERAADQPAVTPDDNPFAAELMNSGIEASGVIADFREGVQRFMDPTNPGSMPDRTGRNSASPGSPTPDELAALRGMMDDEIDAATTEALTESGVDYTKVSPELRAMAEAKHAQAVVDEPAATAALEAALADFDGGRLEGLQYRFKGAEGIADKVRRKQRESLEAGKDPRSDEDETGRIGDALRYTALIPDDLYDTGGAAVLASLEDAGFEVDTEGIKNLWARGDDYSGINIKLTTPTGIPMELQVHTQASYDAKMAIHPLYELSRDPNVDDLVRLEAFDEMVKVWDDVPLPNGWDSFFNEPLTPQETPEGLERYKRTAEFGLKYDPTSKAKVDPVRELDANGDIDWGEEQVIALADLDSISLSESWIDGDDVDKVNEPDFAFRENYPIKLYRDSNGMLHVVDGNTRLAMRKRLGQDAPVVIYDGPVPEAPSDVAGTATEVRAALRLDPNQQALRRNGQSWANERGLKEFDFPVNVAEYERGILAAGAADLAPEAGQERFDGLNELLESKLAQKVGGKSLYNKLGPSGNDYVAARAAVHREIVAWFAERAEAAGIPKERRALMTAGLAGSGKTFSLNPGMAASDLDAVVWDPAKSDVPPPGATHVALSSDYMKQVLAELGLNPGIPGLKPMEEASLMHGESGDIARLLEQHMASLGFNIVLDGTLRDEGKARDQLDMLRRAGYDKPDLVGADITVEESEASALARYIEEAAKNPTLGGRFVPASAARGGFESRLDRKSVTRDNMDHMITENLFGRAVIVNNEGVSNFAAATIDDVNPAFPLPAAKAAQLRGTMSDTEWNAELSSRGITVADGFARVVGRADGGTWSEYEGTPIDPDVDLGPAGYPKRPVDEVRALPGVGDGDGTRDNPFRVTDVNSAAILLLEGEHFIELDQERKVALLVDRLGELVAEARSNKRKLAIYDLCKVTVPGTNLFCAENKGYPRLKMPQLATENPIPGSWADRQPRTRWNDVNLVPAFLDYLTSEGIDFVDTSVQADELKATQSELTGSKIVRNLAERRAEIKRDPTDPGRRILVTRDGYILDGHHGWATNVAIAIGDNKPVQQAVTLIDADILDILDRTVKWATDMGSPPQGAAMPDPPMQAPVAPAAVAAGAGRKRRRGVRGLPPGTTRACYTC